MLFQRLAQRPEVQEFLVLLVDGQRDGRAAGGAVGFLGFIFHAVGADPAHGGRVGVALGVDDHLVGDHERAVEAQAEMADDFVVVGGVLVRGVLAQEIRGAGEGHLRDVFFDFLGGHAQAVVAEGDGSGFLVQHHVHAIGRVVLRGLAGGHQAPVLAHRVAGVADHFANEDVLIRIEPLLDDRHNVLGVYRYSTMSVHIISLPWLVFIILILSRGLVKGFLALDKKEC